MADAFFQATKNALVTLTSLCDLIHPLTVAMWNTRSQVIGTYSVNPNVTPHQMASKYGLGSGIHGVNYKRAFVETSWDVHQENIAWLMLNSIIPIYESWITSLHDQVFTDTNGNISLSAMKNPITSKGGGIVAEINRLTATESQVIKNAYYAEYSAKRHRCFPKLNNLLICFRYFKQMRNCYMHNNSVANSDLIDRYNEFSSIILPAELNMSEIPEHYAPVLGQRIKLSLRGVIGFSQIIIQIMVTADAELLRSEYAEKELVQCLKLVAPTPITINSDRNRAMRQIKGIFKSAGYIAPNLSSLTEITRFLIDNRIIYPITLS